jgi:hypothetical protein
VRGGNSSVCSSKSKSRPLIGSSPWALYP